MGPKPLTPSLALLGGFVAPAKAQGTESLPHPASSTWHQSLQENLESSPHSSPTSFFLKSVNEGESLPGCGCHRPAGNVHPGNVIGINCLALFDLWAVGALLLPAQLGDPQGTVTPVQTSRSSLRHVPHPCSELDSVGIAPFRKLYPPKTPAERKSGLEKGRLEAGIECKTGLAPDAEEGEEKPWGPSGPRAQLCTKPQ